MSQKPSLKTFRQQIRSVSGQPDLTPPVAEVVEDFWNSWSSFETSIAGGTVSLSVDMFRLGSIFPERKRYHPWKGAGKLILMLAFLLVWFQWMFGAMVGLIGLALHIYGEHLRKADAQRFMESLIAGVTEGTPTGMANLCAHYVAGTVELVNGPSRAYWPLYPSNVLTGKNARVKQV
jgi:hypothetical protein